MTRPPQPLVRQVRAVLITAVVAVAAVGVGCGRDDRPSTSSASGASPTSPGATSPDGSTRAGWFALVATADDPNDLDRETQELVASLGSGIVVAPADCFDGIPAPQVGYVLGVFGTSRAEVEAALARAGRRARFVGRVRMICLD